MSGHSKWANIKHKKAREDAKRGKIFTKLIKEITVAARTGGGDTSANSRLRLLVEKAKKANMPQDNITRAIKKGTGELPGATYEEAVYEGYGPDGIAVIAETLSDNKNRTVSNLRHVFSKMGGNLAESGAVLWMFAKKGVLMLRANGLTEDIVLEKLLDYDVDDVTALEEVISVVCSVNDLETVKKAAEQAGMIVESSEIEWVAKDTMGIEDKAMEEKAYTLLQALENLDDVQNVYTNLC